MHLRPRSIVLAALPALFAPRTLAQQSWPVPSPFLGVETIRDEHGHAVRAMRDADFTVQGGGAPLVANWQALGPFGGDIDDVQVSPINANVVLAGLAPASLSGGGLYRSTDAGATWTNVLSLDGKVVHDIAFAPDGTAYAGTIDGVWKSVDSGATFTNLPLSIGLNDQVLEIDVDPLDPLRLWIGIGDALGGQPVNVMLSTNGGTTWANRTPPLASPMTCATIAIDPNDSNEVYAGFRGFGGGGQVWVSTNGGASWTNRSAGLPLNRPVNDIVHDGARVLCGGGQLFGSQTFGLWSSLDLGATWTQLSSGLWPNLVVNDVAVDPNSTLNIFATTAGAGLFRSTDGGATWAFGAGGTGSLSINAVSFAPGSSTTLFTGSSSNAVWKSTNGGASFAASSVGIGALDVYSIDSNPLAANELAIAFQGLNDGGVFTSTDAGATWSLAALPGTRFNQVRFSPAGTLYAISDGPSSIALEGLYRRVGSTWSPIGPDQGTLFESELFGMRVSANDPNFIVAVGADFGVAGFEPTVWRTIDGGAIWTKVYEGPSPNKPLQDVLVVDPAGDTTWVASFTDFSGGNAGGVLRSVDVGVSWNPSLTGLPVGMQAYSLASTALGGGALYVSNSGAGANAVYRSVDGGASWAPTGFLGQAFEVQTDPVDANTLYIAQTGAVRVRVSTDGGATFSPFNTGLQSNEFPRDLQRTATAGKLLLAASKGSYSTDLVPPPVPFCFGDGSVIPCPCGNNGSAGNGCANSAFPVGAHLAGSGAASVAADSFVLTATNLTGNAAVFFQGDATTPHTVIDDGLGCVGGLIRRLGNNLVAGNASSYPQPGDVSISVRGLIPPLGGTYYYQCFYRNAAPLFCPPATSNRTNGVQMLWVP